jgi:hypothetical protein
VILQELGFEVEEVIKAELMSSNSSTLVLLAFAVRSLLLDLLRSISRVVAARARVDTPVDVVSGALFALTIELASQLR